MLYRHYPLYPVVDGAQHILGVVHGWKLYERIASELSGQAGAQALAITLRGMTLGQLRYYPVGKLLRKEILLGALNGVIVGLIAESEGFSGLKPSL